MYSFKKIPNKFLEKKISISIAESCTGGQLSKVFTDIPGISKIFQMGLVVYSNYSKNKILKIPLESIKRHGAVSKEVARLMSENLFKISKSDLCISTTGISGPTGGSKRKPIGLVYIGITFKKKTVVLKNNFLGERKEIQKKTIIKCLKEINKLI